MSDALDKARGALDPTLWAVSIQGPDDIIAAADHLSAVKIANTFNRFWQQMKEKAPQRAHDPRMWAVPVEWPYTAKSHAESLVSGPGPDYDEMVSAALSALDQPSGVRVKKLEWRERAIGDGTPLRQMSWEADIYQIVQSPSGNYDLRRGTYAICETIEAAKAAAQAHHDARILSALDLSAIGAEGWKLVPEEPTLEMIKAAHAHHEGEAWLPHSLYTAMLAAAPSPPEPHS
jgi:hypothetical protein